MQFITTPLRGFGRDANQLCGPNGREMEVVSIRRIEDATQQTKFITLYPARR